jgi:GTP-binding protein EngB required for normal cell division
VDLVVTIRLPGRRATADRAAADDVGARLRALDRVVELGEGRIDRIDNELLDPARALSRRASERLRLSGAHTVVALAGATGSGKSTLFNALAGTPMSETGVRRPTTGVAHAVVWDAEGAGPLLDWLEIPRRHHLQLPDGDDGDDLRGLVLLDLPDHDSTEVAHRLEVDRLVALVDVLVWVLDPQKYADAAIHDRYLRRLARHGEVMVVVLNQVDRLAPEVVPDALADVRRLLAADGLADVPVLATSAATGVGLDRLRAVLVGAVAAHRAALRRVAADLDTVAADLEEVVGGPARDDVEAGAQRALVAALGAAAGIPAVGAAVQRASVHRAVTTTGFPFTRWLRRLRPDPLRRLHLDRARMAAVTGSPTPTDDDAADLVATAQRTSLPAPGAVERSRVDLALRRLADDASAGLPDPWPELVGDAARSRAGDLADGLDRAVATTDLGMTRRPLWWRAVGALQALLAAAVVAGALWLAGLYALTVLRLPEPEPPEVGMLPLPTVLVIGGLLAGLLLALLARMLAVLGARRRRARAEARLRESVADVADALVLAPVRAELAAYSELRGAVATLRR